MTSIRLISVKLISAIFFLTASASVSAAVSGADAAALGISLTPLGAETAGNEAGTIPAWDGGMTQPPAGYEPGTRHLDPFDGEQPLFVITAENAAQYSDNLSTGQMAMFQRYPDTFRMQVYPTHRTASYPQWIYDATVENATNATLDEAGNGVLNAAQGFPFPIPQNGLEAIWNHLLRYRGEAVQRMVGQVVPAVNGEYIEATLLESVLFAYNQPDATPESINNKLAYFLQELIAPPVAAGNAVLVHETLNQTAELRKVWTYNPGQRRVRRAPHVGYDTPGTATDGQRVADQLDMFNGAPDRYDWQLVGKKELYIPYNSYRLHSGDVTVGDIVRPGHINPDLVRYELHRVWVVEATLKEGTSHIYARRTFYLDEDSWQISVVDQYDGSGAIWRVSEAYPINYYEVPVQWLTLESVYDVQNGRYVTRGFDNQDKPYDFSVNLRIGDFKPDRLRRKGR